MSQASNDMLTYFSREREQRQKPLDWPIIRRLFTFTRPYARRRNILFTLAAVRSVQMPLLAWTIAVVINGPIYNHDIPGTILGAIGFAALAIFTAVTFHFRMRFALQLGEVVVHDLRARIFAHLQRMSMSFYDRTKLGGMISRMTSDAEAVRFGIQDVAFVTVVQLGNMVVAALIMLWYDPALFGVLLVMVPVLWVIVRFFHKRLSVAWRNVQESFSRVTATVAESVNGIRVTQGFVRQDRNAELFEDLVERHSNYHMDTARLSGTFLPLLELNNQLFIALLVLVGGYQIIRGGFFATGTQTQQLEAIVVFFFQIPLFFGPIATIGRQYSQAMTAMAGAERIFRLFDTEPENLDAPDAIDPPLIQGRVEFRDVHFAYHPETMVLHGLDFIAEPGQTVALVGETGCGKTTTIKLISKFYLPTSGEITIDGHDIHKLKADGLRRQLGIVTQANFLFTGTVMDNIRIGNTGASDLEVIDAARKLDCLDLLETLPDGLHTQVGERGTSLSLGQRQLVCFARAMLADPRILILDEATSSVDTMTEFRIQRALAKLLEGRTSFVIAHRLSTIRHADQVLVMDDGRIIERGTHAQLLADAGAYANLYRQFIHSTEA